MPQYLHGWYILKADDGYCQILLVTPSDSEAIPAHVQAWGPYESQEEAIARRVGLIRANQCKPK